MADHLRTELVLNALDMAAPPEEWLGDDPSAPQRLWVESLLRAREGAWHGWGALSERSCSCRVGAGRSTRWGLAGSVGFVSLGRSWERCARGLGAVRNLVAHEADGYEEWGASGSVRVTPGGPGRGFSLTLAPAIGVAPSRAERL